MKTFNKDIFVNGIGISTKIPILNFSTGSLGHGLPFGCGLALNKLIYNRKNKVYWKKPKYYC